MKARIMCRGGVIGFCDKDPQIPMGSLVNILGHFIWVFAGEVERAKDSLEDDTIVYQVEDMGEIRDLPTIEIKK